MIILVLVLCNPAQQNFSHSFRSFPALAGRVAEDQRRHQPVPFRDFQLFPGFPVRPERGGEADPAAAQPERSCSLKILLQNTRYFILKRQ
ncbi:hypothetical protein RCIA168 [Methanocella arvoryzae MRE50]|uniref:Uncharacterized protein n=1 Tax=Methanocella arvoryzae (strain DSM 22066 / NBRC 105507 / MRE50) TaxID=351160 RepID=Q0W2F4_METAR|nr:hypothetical protein RCIA168 [Methanocella arvoryzae MRE50]